LEGLEGVSLLKVKITDIIPGIKGCFYTHTPTFEGLTRF